MQIARFFVKNAQKLFVLKQKVVFLRML